MKMTLSFTRLVGEESSSWEVIYETNGGDIPRRGDSIVYAEADAELCKDLHAWDWVVDEVVWDIAKNEVTLLIGLENEQV